MGAAVGVQDNRIWVRSGSLADMLGRVEKRLLYLRKQTFCGTAEMVSYAPITRTPLALASPFLARCRYPWRSHRGVSILRPRTIP
jgi:hypothetical protein